MEDIENVRKRNGRDRFVQRKVVRTWIDEVEMIEGQIGREVGARKPAAPPGPGEVVGLQFSQRKACHVNEGYPPGEAFAAFLDERRRGGSATILARVALPAWRR